MVNKHKVYQNIAILRIIIYIQEYKNTLIKL